MTDDPLAFFLTWTTYGTWLPGDERGWVKRHQGFHEPDGVIQRESLSLLAEPPLTLDDSQRAIVTSTIERHADIRGWPIYVVNVRTNHVHIVLTADGYRPEVARDQFKAWSTRKLKEQAASRGSQDANRTHWWTEGGSQRWINTEDDLEAVIIYVKDAQDQPRNNH